MRVTPYKRVSSGPTGLPRRANEARTSPVTHRSLIIDGRDLERQQERARRAMRFLWAAALLGAKCKLTKGDGGDPHLADRLAAQPLQGARMLLDDGNAGVGTGHV